MFCNIVGTISFWIFGTIMFGSYLLEKQQQLPPLPQKHVKSLNWCLDHCLGEKQGHAEARWILEAQRHSIKHFFFLRRCGRWQKQLAGPETVLVKAQFFWMSLAPWRQANFCCEKLQGMDSKTCCACRKLTFFSSEDAFQSFDGFLLQVGIEVDVPPLPRLGVKQ